MEKIVIIDDESEQLASAHKTLVQEGFNVLTAKEGQQGLSFLAREKIDLVIADFDLPGFDGVEFIGKLREAHPNQKCIIMTPSGAPEAVLAAFQEKVCDILPKPFEPDDLREAVKATLKRCPIAQIQVVSAKPDWVEFLVPCDLEAVAPLQRALSELESDVSQESRDALEITFREMLNNAIEHGGKLDPTKHVEVSFTKLNRSIVYQIKDPGVGFDPSRIPHAAQSGGDIDPTEHMAERDAQGLRAGGFGILLAKNLVDEVIYNERGNKLMFVKYL